MIEWFYGKEGRQFGPIDEATLRARVASGEIGSDDLVWREGMERWQPLKEVAELGGAAPMPSVDSPLPPTESSGDEGVPPPVPNSPYATPEARPEGAMYRPGPGVPVTNGPAIASLVCGILSIVFFCLFGGIFFGIPAVICGHIAMSSLNRPDNLQQGRGLAIAGLVCGYCGLVILILMLVQGSANVTYNDYMSR